MSTAASKPEASGGRVWGGTTLAERKAARQTTLREATLDLIGEQGAAGVTVRSVCRRAGLTDRYFYESFAGRDELLAAVFLQVLDELQAALAAAAASGGSPEDVARRAISALAEIGLDDPRKGRLLLVEPMSDPALTGVTVAVAPEIMRMVRAQLPTGESKARTAMIALGLVGALASLFSTWIGGQLRVTREELIEHCVELTVDAFYRGKALPAD